MPTYEYRCEACGHEFEIEQRITADRLTDCPACKQPKLERLISASSFTLKGGGWYKDGYGSPKTPRTESQVADRLSKAINEDKQKEAAPAAASESSSTASESTSSSTTSTASAGSTSSSSTS